MMDDRPERQPLPSEDTGDLGDEPASGDTDDYLVAREEGVPYVPPTDRVVSEARRSQSGVDVAGTDDTDAGELEREDAVQPEDGALPRDDELRADVISALRASDVPAGDRIRIAVTGSRVHVAGEVESVDVLDEILGIVGDVVGVDEVLDEVTVTRL
ncbi:MAG TPA: BON domain-containing protein [Candidatus Limnocylindria bacterium]